MVNRAPQPRDQRTRAVLARDAALTRISRARVLMLVAAVALTALLAAVASALLPGKSLASSKTAGAGAKPPSPVTSRAARHSRTTSGRMPAPAGPAALGLQGPSQAPTAVAPKPISPPPVSSAPPAQSAPAPAASSGGGAVVSGGS
jgi:hypothetical protein